MMTLVERVILQRVLADTAIERLTEIQSWIIFTYLQNNDFNSARDFISSLNKVKDVNRRACISQWHHDGHFYALDRKFETFSDAKKYLEQHGFIYSGLKERFQYLQNGD